MLYVRIFPAVFLSLFMFISAPAVAEFGNEAPILVGNEGGGVQCAGDGINYCQCYCRVTLNSCEDGQASNSSLPLCNEKWDDNGECQAIAYPKTAANNQNACQDLNGSACKGYVRPGNNNPAALANREVDGKLLGCGIVAAPL